MVDLDKCPVCKSKNAKNLSGDALQVPFITENQSKMIDLPGMHLKKCLDCGEEYISFDEEQADFDEWGSLKKKKSRTGELLLNALKEGGKKLRDIIKY